MYYSTASLFLLKTFIVFIESRMALVSECPKNKTEVAKASQKLGCGVDKYGNIQYLCLPKKEKTSLVELCIDRVMGIQDKGNCLEVFEGKVIKHSCYNFSWGCPETHFYEYEFFKYPACQNINTEFHCYIADPLCPAIPRTKESYNYIAIILTSVGSLILVVIIGIIVCFLWRRKNSKREEHVAEMVPLSNGESPLQTTQISSTCVESLRVRKGKAKISTDPDSGITDFPLCFNCNNSIRGSLVKVLGKTWCPNHFICQYNGCGRNLVHTGFYEKEGVFYCKQHFALICNKCGKSIKKEYVMAQQKTYHSDCFTCYTCKKPISGSVFQHEDGTFYCENHTHKEECKGCNKSIDPTVNWVEALQSAYHPKCFNCTTCGVNLVDQPHYPKGEKPYCKIHY